MSTRFEVLKNGKRVCISGIIGDGVLCVGLNYVSHPGQESTYDLQIGGLGMFDGSQDRQHHASWPSPDLAVGDEITIRILPPGEYDQPYGMIDTARKTIEDPELGNSTTSLMLGMPTSHLTRHQLNRPIFIFRQTKQAQHQINAI